MAIEAVLKFFSEKRFYVFFEDGSWRTCTDEQWKEEQVWKLKPVLTGWFGGPFEAKALKAVFERFSKDEERP